MDFKPPMSQLKDLLQMVCRGSGMFNPYSLPKCIAVGARTKASTGGTMFSQIVLREAMEALQPYAGVTMEHDPRKHIPAWQTMQSMHQLLCFWLTP